MENVRPIAASTTVTVPAGTALTGTVTVDPVQKKMITGVATEFIAEIGREKRNMFLLVTGDTTPRPIDYIESDLVLWLKEDAAAFAGVAATVVEANLKGAAVSLGTGPLQYVWDGNNIDAGLSFGFDSDHWKNLDAHALTTPAGQTATITEIT